ncbi:hypothetical protein A674_01625 [Salmonella enterica subsp. enterica serovar Enteritidis str. 2009K1651]|nr:hypothetical protein A674_01625 [Salmonella enterica subsp. enterica serovar Enteritidis str. 2009K1651]
MAWQTKPPFAISLEVLRVMISKKVLNSPSRQFLFPNSYLESKD